MSTEASPTGFLVAPAAPIQSASSLRSRVTVLAVVLAVGAIVSAAFSIWHPEPDANDEFGYSVMAPIRTSWWAWHVLGGLGTAVLAISLGLAVCLLAPRRGAAWATGGAIVTSLGGLAFLGAMGAEAVLGYYVTDTDALPVDTGTNFISYVNDNFAQLGVMLFPGFMLLGLGGLLLAVALWRAGSVPRWSVVAFAVTNLAGAVLPFGVVADVVNTVFFATILALAWFVWKSVAGVRLTVEG